jgi:hypothetical protein
MIAKFLEERDALMRNPTLETATAWWYAKTSDEPASPNVPLAAIHKARLQWLSATDIMLAESIKWLEENGYQTTFQGVPPLTPESRDARRAKLGKAPLGETK